MERKGLHTRGLAVGSSQLPWAHIKLADHLVPVKGLVGLDSGAVCSRDARSSSTRPIPRPGTVAPSAARRPVVGGEDEPADSIDGRPMVRRNAATSAGGTVVAAPRADARPKPRRPIPRDWTPRASVPRKGARVSAQPTIPDFFAVTGRAVRSTLHPPSGVPASGFAAPLAVRRCAASSSASGSGAAARTARAHNDPQAGRAVPELG